MEDLTLNMSVVNRPGGHISARPLYFFWVCDCSGSMSIDGKIFQLNNAIREALLHMVDVAENNPNANIMVRALKFSDNAEWVNHTSVPVDQFDWQDLEADGVTNMGQALSLLSQELKMPPMDERALKPVIVLISDGQPTDNFKKGLNDLLGEPWGIKAVRIGIAIGKDAKEDVLQEFINNPEIKPLHANNPQALTKYIQFVSTFVIQETSSPSSQIESSQSQLSKTISEKAGDIDEQIDEDDIW